MSPYKSRASLLDHLVLCIQLSDAGYQSSPNSQEYRGMVPMMPVDDEGSEGSASTKVVMPGVGASGARKQTSKSCGECKR